MKISVFDQKTAKKTIKKSFHIIHKLPRISGAPFTVYLQVPVIEGVIYSSKYSIDAQISMVFFLIFSATSALD